jgi:hypothetical protein
LFLFQSLTSLGDERPCARCVKRGLAEQCQDGVRKKAKYLHDAPPEALIPPNLGGTYNLNIKLPSSVSMPSASLPATASFYHPTSASMDLYPHTPNALQISHGMPPSSIGYTCSALSPIFNSRSQNSVPSTPGGHMTQTVGAYPFDPSDPALFNLDIGNFNFVNQYGALEFGMLGHMTSNAHDGNEAQTPIHPIPNPYNAAFQQPRESNSVLFPQDAMMNMDYNTAGRHHARSVPPLQTPHNTPVIQSVDRNDLPLPSNGPSAYAIAARPNSLASGSPDPLDHLTPSDSASSPALFATDNHFGGHHPVQAPPVIIDRHQINPRKKHSEDIYNSVKKPWSYTENWHRLFTYLKKHYSNTNMSRISQSLAAVRPALLTFAQNLNDADLVFMEVCVQRTLLEFNDFISTTGTPTLVARRDGTILAVSEEFCLMTGWPKRVLLGHNPNRMVSRSTGSTSAGTTTAAASGRGTRRGSPELLQESKINGSAGQHTSTSSTKPDGGVFVAEVMDQDSTVQFYEDYAKLAFTNPHGRGMRRGKLLKYRTPEDLMRLQSKNGSRVVSRRNSRAADDIKPILDDEGIASEGALRQLGEPDGMVDCMYSWWIKRDMFEVPLLMIMNVSLLSLIETILTEHSFFLFFRPIIPFSHNLISVRSFGVSSNV